MHLHVALLSALILVACAGCVDADGNPISFEVYDEDVLEPGHNTTPPAPVNATPSAPDPAPVVTAVATTPYMAPVEIAIDEFEGDHAVLRLIAGPDGLRCEAEPRGDPLPTPAGYKPGGAWASCSLSVGNLSFATARSDRLAANMSLMAHLPVESFTWNMTVGRILINNTGAHEEVLHEVSRVQDPSPKAGGFQRQFDDDPGLVLRHNDPFDVCDGGLGMEMVHDGVATLRIGATARNSMAILEFSLAGLDVREIDGPGGPTGNWYVTDDDVLVAWGPWAHQSVAEVAITIDFESQGRSLGLLPPDECPEATRLDRVYYPFHVTAPGIAADWSDSVTKQARADIWLVGA